MGIRRSIEFELNEPVEFTAEGSPVSCSTVTVKAPAPKQRQRDLWLKQQFLLALPKGKEAEEAAARQKAAGKKDDDVDNEDVMLMLGSCPEVNLAEFFENAKQVLCHGVAFLGAEPMTTEIFDRLDFDEAQDLVGAYMINFTIRSVLASQKKT